MLKELISHVIYMRIKFYTRSEMKRLRIWWLN